MQSEKIIIIDGNSLMNRAFYAIPLLHTKHGVYTNAVYGFINMLNKIIEDYNPEYITVAFDRKAPTFRHLAYDAYKAGRKKMPPELAQQLPILKKILDAFKIYRIEIDGFEADDLMGTLVKYCEKMNILPIVVTGDKDALQLASDKTKILITKKGMSTLEIYDQDSVIERYEVTPQQFIDLKGLMGDKSDNIPGIPGVGEKTGIKLIKKFGSIENLIGNIEQITNKNLRNKIEEYEQQAVLSKRLATIKVDIPIEVSLEELRREKPNRDELLDLFSELEFYSLINIFKNEEHSDEVPVQLSIQAVQSSKEINKMKAEIKSKGALCFKIFNDESDIEKKEILALSILIDEEKSYFIDTTEDHNLILELKDIFEDARIKKYGHDLKMDILALKQHGIALNGIFFDSAIALYLLEPTRPNYEIDDISAEYLKKMIFNQKEFLGKSKKKIAYHEISKEKLMEYGHSWCYTVNSIKSIFIQRLKEYDLEKLYFEVELPLIEVLADMEFQGFKVNPEILHQIGGKLDKKINQITLEIFQQAGEEFNINSTKQLGQILFDKLGLPVIRKTKTGYSTNIEVLEKLYNQHDIIPKIIEYRQLVKLKSTYIDGLITVIHKRTSKIYSNFNQTVTVTGRISSTEPNLQNIPIKFDVGRDIRKAFVPTNTDYLLLDADYSQIELRVLAHISKDVHLIQAFQEGKDIHAATASKVFNVPIEEVTPLQRSRAKAVNFGIVYGISDYGLSENLHITKKEAQKYIDEYFHKYDGVKKYMEDIITQGKEEGYVTTLLNRRRYIPELKSKNYVQRAFGERTAMNTPIQGSAADIIKIAMVQVYKELKSKKLKSRMILQVHDELIVEIHKDEIEEVQDIVKYQMENAAHLDVPLKVDMHLGDNWYDIK